jgi:alpha-1,6-mannosyltransferase
MSIKTLHITNSFHSTSGGIRITYQALLEASNRLKRFVRLVVPGERDSIEDIGAYGRIYTLRAPPLPFFDRRYRTILPTSILFPWWSKVWTLIRRERPELIEVADKLCLPYLAGLLRKGWISGIDRPLLVGMSCERLDDTFNAYLPNHAALRTLSHWYLGNVYIPQFDLHLANSHYTADELMKATVPKHHRTVSVMPMGVDCEMFRPERRRPEKRQALEQRFQASSNSVLLLFAGRLAPEKNLELLVEMMKRLGREPGRDYRLLIAGDGPMRASFEVLSQQVLPGSVRFLGHIGDREMLADLFANSDVFVHPNPHEPFGIAPLEAMASGLPLVAPNSGGLTTYANGSNAWLTDAHGSSFACAVKMALANGTTRRRRVERACQTARVHSWPLVTERLLSLYDELHSQQSRTRGQQLRCSKLPRSRPSQDSSFRHG